MAENPALLTLSVDAGRGADDEETADLTRRLRQHFLDGEIDKVELARSGDAPAGSKGDAVALSSLIVTLAPVALTGMIGMLQAWLSRHERATVTVESGGDKLTLTGSLTAEQQKTVAAFLDRHKS